MAKKKQMPEGILIGGPDKGIKVKFRVHTPALLNEILNNPGTSVLTKPIQIFGHILFELGEVARRINDPELNAMMLRLTIYSAADPESPDYNEEVVQKHLIPFIVRENEA
jgi:hypothetical protein